MSKSRPTKGSDPKKTDLQTLNSQSVSPYEKLKLGILHLNNFRADGNPKVFISESTKLMKILIHAFKGEKGENMYIPWVKFLSVAYKSFGNFDDTDEFKNGMEGIIKTLLLSQVDKKQGLDWRIARKMLAVKQIFNDVEELVPSDQDFITPIKFRLEEALDYLDWEKDQETLARQVIENLLKVISAKDEETREDLRKAIVSGRFAKGTFEKFGLKETIIVGEDGGLYVLLNSLSHVDQEKRHFIEKIVGQDYLKDKIKADGKVVIGKGGFGTVRFALNLIEGVRKPNDLICIKKSKSYEKIKSMGVFKPSPIEEITDNTLGDYFTNDLAEVLYAPKVVDMAIVNERELEPQHKKGYLMMEVVPQNTGNKMFNPGKGKTTEYQKWEHQKPYLLDVLNGMLQLLENGVAMTDLKPENTLYDKDLRQATIIDLGGTVKPEKKEELGKFDPKKYDIQSTEGYSAPELAREEIMDLNKAVAYACGKVIESVTVITDYHNKQEISGLISGLTAKEPKERMEIKKAIEVMKKMGSDDYKEHVIFHSYVNKVKERISSHNNQSSIGLNDDIKQTKELLVPLEVTTLDPYRYNDLERFAFDEKIDQFFESKEKRVFLLLGAAGAGKSIALQLRFIDAVEKWKQGEPLPIYFNLANGVDLEKVLEKLNQELKTGLSINKNLQDKNVHLYMDSFDEGFYADRKKKEGLIKNYLEKLGKDNTKIFVSCRSDYNTEDRWFYAGGIETLEKYYVAPLELESEEDLKTQIKKYLERKTKQEHKKETIDEYTKRIKESGIAIKTGFMLYMVLSALPYLEGKQAITKESIFQQYAKNHSQSILKNYTEKQKQKVSKEVSDAIIDSLGQDLATELHLDKKFRINQNNKLLTSRLHYKPHRDFQHQLASHILQLLPLKIEITTSETNGQSTETITIGFRHDALKNFFIGQAIFQANSTILSSYNISENAELVKYLAEITEHNTSYQSKLLKAIFATRSDKTTAATTFAANAITVLVAAKYPFSAMDLSGINIAGANVSNGLFHRTNFTDADLSNAILWNANIVEAVFKSTIMTNTSLGVLPNLVHTSPVLSLAYSPDNKTLATGSEDGHVKIWDIASGKELQTLQGAAACVFCVAYSPDGKHLATGSQDKNVIVWDIAGGKQVHVLQGHTESVYSVVFSPDGKKIVSASGDKTTKIWNVTSGQEIKSLLGHTRTVRGVVYSPDGKLLATSSEDTTARIWNPETGAEIQVLKGHVGFVNSLVFSPEGKVLATGASDGSIRIWDLASGNELKILKGHNDNVTSVVYSPDGKTLASGSRDSAVKIWDTMSGKELQTLRGKMSPVYCIGYAPDGRTIAAACDDPEVKIWYTGTGKQLQSLEGHKEAVSTARFSPDGKAIASGSEDGIVKVWNVENGKERQMISESGLVYDVRWSPDGRSIITGTKENFAKMWSLETGRIVKKFEAEEGSAGSVKSVLFSPDGKTIVTGSLDFSARIWDVETGKQIQVLLGHKNSIHGLACSPDGKTIATCSFDSTIRIWDKETGKEIQMIKGHSGLIESVAYSPDGKKIASGGVDGTARIWDFESGKEVKVFKGHFDSVVAVAFSPDGRNLATGSWDMTVKVWEVETGKVIQTLYAHSDWVTAVEFSKDGKSLVTGSKDHTVKLFVKEKDVWLVKREITRAPLLKAEKVVVDGVVNLSDANLEVLKQRGCVLLGKPVWREIPESVQRKHSEFEEKEEEKEDERKENGGKKRVVHPEVEVEAKEKKEKKEKSLSVWQKLFACGSTKR